MNTVTYKVYETMKQDFFKKHDYEYKVDTSSLNEYDSYHKEYIFTDGAIWYENMRPVTEKAEATVHGLKIEVEVKLFETEFWRSEESESFRFFERY